MFSIAREAQAVDGRSICFTHHRYPIALPPFPNLHRTIGCSHGQDLTLRRKAHGSHTLIVLERWSQRMAGSEILDAPYTSSDGARQQECSAILSIDRCEQRADLFIDFFRARHGVRDIRPQQFAKAPPQPKHGHFQRGLR